MTNEIITTIERPESINSLYIIEEHYENGDVRYCVAYESDGTPTNGNQYERFESLSDAVEYMENF